jgi:hypothetical protein
MLIRFAKGKRADVLTCMRDDGTVTWMHERPGFVLHDLAHYAVENGFGYALGFYGLVAHGWELSSSDFGRDPRTKERYPWPSGKQEPVEYVVSLFQRRFAGVQTPDEIRAAMAVYYGEVPREFTDERIEATRAALERLHRRWAEVADGGSLELRFPAVGDPIP